MLKIRPDYSMPMMIKYMDMSCPTMILIMSLSCAVLCMSCDCVPLHFLSFFFYTHLLYFTYYVTCRLPCNCKFTSFLSRLETLDVITLQNNIAFCCFCCSLSTYIKFTTANNNPSSSSSSCTLKCDVTK
jgi:hypothetical protein